MILLAAAAPDRERRDLQAQVGAVVDDLHLLQVEPGQPCGPPAQRREVLPSSPCGRPGRPGPIRQNQRSSCASFRLAFSGVRFGKTRVAQASVGQAQIVPRRRASRANPRELQVAAAVVGGNALGREVGDHVELVFAHHLDDRDALFAERARLRLPPCGPVAERSLRRVLDLRGVDPVVLVLHLDGERARSIGGLGDRNREIAMSRD